MIPTPLFVGPAEITAIVIVVLVLFGLPVLLPKIGKRFGRTVERSKHVGDDVAEGRREIEEELGDR